MEKSENTGFYEMKETMVNYSCGIEKLAEHRVFNRDGEWYGMEVPSTREMMDKINEIIDVLDRICGKTY